MLFSSGGGGGCGAMGGRGRPRFSFVFFDRFWPKRVADPNWRQSAVLQWPEADALVSTCLFACCACYFVFINSAHSFISFLVRPCFLFWAQLVRRFVDTSERSLVGWLVLRCVRFFVFLWAVLFCFLLFFYLVDGRGMRPDGSEGMRAYLDVMAAMQSRRFASASTHLEVPSLRNPVLACRSRWGSHQPRPERLGRPLHRCPSHPGRSLSPFDQVRSGLSVSPRSPVGKQPSADRDVGSWPGSGSFSGIGAASAAAVPGFLSTTASSADPREPAWETGRGRERESRRKGCPLVASRTPRRGESACLALGPQEGPQACSVKTAFLYLKKNRDKMSLLVPAWKSLMGF